MLYHSYVLRAPRCQLIATASAGTDLLEHLEAQICCIKWPLLGNNGCRHGRDHCILGPEGPGSLLIFNKPLSCSDTGTGTAEAQPAAWQFATKQLLGCTRARQPRPSQAAARICSIISPCGHCVRHYCTILPSSGRLSESNVQPLPSSGSKDQAVVRQDLKAQWARRRERPTPSSPGRGPDDEIEEKEVCNVIKLLPWAAHLRNLSTEDLEPFEECNFLY